MATTNTNRIREIRLEKGLTQKALAGLVGTSQQQIQRIETGMQSARLEIAGAICRALNSPLESVFPGTENLVSHRIEDQRAVRDVESIAKAHAAGLEIDAASYTLKVRLLGGYERCFPIQSDDRDRIVDVLQDADCSGSIEFYSNEDWIHLNLKHLTVAQLLWDVSSVSPARPSVDDQELAVRVWLVGQDEPLVYGVNPDTSDEMLDDRYELKDLVFYAGLDTDDMLRFEDEDGEWVFLRKEHISLISVSLAALYPSLLPSDD